MDEDDDWREPDDGWWLPEPEDDEETMGNRYLTILGKRWKFRTAPNLGEIDGFWNDGDCNYETHTLRVRSGLKGFDYIEALLHESLHAASDALGEEFVDELARDLRRILERPDVRQHFGE